MNSFFRLLLATPLLLISSCTKNSNPVDPGTPGTGGTITTGPVVDVATQTIPASGGTITVNKPGDLLDGFQLIVPSNAFAQSQNISISYSEIKSHALGSYITPASPLIKISSNGGYSAQEIKIKVPIKLSPGYFAMGFFYDETSGKLEPLSVEKIDSTSIVITTRQLSLSEAGLGKGFFKTSQGVYGNLIISSIIETALRGKGVISTGFKPGTDDWEFPNYGSYIAPGGHCAGQSVSAMWYFYEQKLKGAPALFKRFDKISDPNKPDSLWCDNPLGYRFASTIQKDMKFEDWVRDIKYGSWVPNIVFNSFAFAMLVNAEPQLVLIRNSLDSTGHAMVVYAIGLDEMKLYIADPNYPNNRARDGSSMERVIQYTPGSLTGQFLPYSSAPKAGEAGKSYDQIGYAAKTTHIEWSQIRKRWAEFQNRTIGNDRFPTYDLFEAHTGARLVEGFDTELDTITVSSVSNGCAGYISGTAHRQEINGYDAVGKFIGRTKNGGELTLALKPGDNTFGLYMMGVAADVHSHYLDFTWMKLHRHMDLSLASTEANLAPLLTAGMKNKLYTFVARSAVPVPKDGKVKYEWSFGDGSPVISVNNDSTVTHTFAQDGTYTIDVGFYYDLTKINTVTAQASIVPTPPVISGIVPSTAGVGDTVKIAGKNFGVDRTKGSVTFNSGVVATQIVSWNDIAITVKVPLGTQTGPLTVTVNNLTSNAVTFTVLVVPSGLLAVAGGTFEMEFIPGPWPGQPGHPVSVGSFKIEKYEITYEKWAEVRDWGRANGYTDLAFGQSGHTPTTTNNPVTMVSWYQVVKWCNARSEKDGLTPVYYTSSALTTVYRTGTIDLGSDAVKWTANGYRLPTEAEWEFAARGGKTGTNWYSGSSTLGDVAWYWTNSGNHTHQVGTKSPNELGIYDMTGNVDEWCWDWYGPLSTSAQTDPKGATSGTKRSQRGGSFAAYDYSCPMAYRYADYPTSNYHVLGFRCVQH